MDRSGSQGIENPNGSSQESALPHLEGFAPSLEQHQSLSPELSPSGSQAGHDESRAGPSEPSAVRVRRRAQPNDEVKHRRTRSGCFTCRNRRVKVSKYPQHNASSGNIGSRQFSAMRAVLPATVCSNSSQRCRCSTIFDSCVSQNAAKATDHAPTQSRRRQSHAEGVPKQSRSLKMSVPRHSTIVRTLDGGCLPSPMKKANSTPTRPQTWAQDPLPRLLRVAKDRIRRPWWRARVRHPR